MTRRVNPDAEVDDAGLTRTITRVLALRGASCARGMPTDQILTACGITIPADDLPVSGQTAAAIVDQVDRAISK